MEVNSKFSSFRSVCVSPKPCRNFSASNSYSSPAAATPTFFRMGRMYAMGKGV